MAGNELIQLVTLPHPSGAAKLVRERFVMIAPGDSSGQYSRGNVIHPSASSAHSLTNQQQARMVVGVVMENTRTILAQRPHGNANLSVLIDAAVPVAIFNGGIILVETSEAIDVGQEVAVDVTAADDAGKAKVAATGEFVVGIAVPGTPPWGTQTTSTPAGGVVRVLTSFGQYVKA